MRVKVHYLINNTVHVARFVCEDVTTQICHGGRGLIVFTNGRDKHGPIDSFQSAHLELIQRRPSAADDDSWLSSFVLQ